MSGEISVSLGDRSLWIVNAYEWSVSINANEYVLIGTRKAFNGTEEVRVSLRDSEAVKIAHAILATTSQTTPSEASNP